MALNGNRPLLNIDGTVYKLSKRDYEHFHKVLEGAFNESNTRYASDASKTWNELLRWVEEHGKYVCRVETYNYLLMKNKWRYAKIC
jgi:hypothetical protein